MTKYYKKILEYGKSYPKLWLSSKLNRALFKPRRIELSISAKCNLRCKMCIALESREKVRLGENIDFSCIKRIIDEMYEWKIPEMYVTGFGETLLRNDIFDIVSYASNRGIRCSTVTNGTIMDEKMCRKIIESGLFKIAVSIDGATPETHDGMRGVEGAFEKTIQGIKTLNRLKNGLNPGIGIITVITNYNFHELPELVTLAKNLGAENIVFQPVHIEELVFESPTNYHVVHNRDYEKSDLWISKENLSKLDKVIDELIERRVRGESIITSTIPMLEMIKGYFRNPRNLNFSCIAGYNSMNIGPQGDVYPCWLFESIGNIRERSLKEVWYSDEYNRARIRMKNCSNKCIMACHYLPGLKDLFSLFTKKVPGEDEKGWDRGKG